MANIVEKMAESMKSLGIRTSYGDKVTVDGVELIPVALVYFGFGGGGGESGAGGGGESESTGEGGPAGEGGGGGGASIPVGAYVTGPNGPRFEPNIIALLAVAIPATWVAGRALARVIRALKR